MSESGKGTLDYLISDVAGMPGSVGTDYVDTEVLLHRTFQSGSNWNTFVFPMDLTTQQVKEAFGENVVIAEPVGVGSMSDNPMIIDSIKSNQIKSHVTLDEGQILYTTIIRKWLLY